MDAFKRIFLCADPMAPVCRTDRPMTETERHNIVMSSAKSQQRLASSHNRQSGVASGNECIEDMDDDVEEEEEDLMNFDPNAWRDTVVVPPNGRARIWVKYKEYTGKTVMHCHFLAHEDTGMMSVLFIGPPDYVFSFQDNAMLFAGIGLGIIVAGIAALMLRGSGKNTEAYDAVAMDELKTKALD